MVFNYLKTALRNLLRYRVYNFINIAGLSLGMACAILIFAVVRFHLSFDNFHDRPDNIYRVVTELHNEQVRSVECVPAPFGRFFREDLTYADAVTRAARFSSEVVTIEKKGADSKFDEQVVFVEPDFISMFNFPLAEGNAATVLKEPNAAIITERLAHKYFGNETALNKTFRIGNRLDVRVTGVMKDIPENTDLRSEIYVSYPTLSQFDEQLAFDSDQAWGGVNSAMQCYVRLKPGVEVATVEKTLAVQLKEFSKFGKITFVFKLQPLTDVHLNTQYSGLISRGDLWALSIIGVFLIIMACVNFINLATAQAATRAREVGVRKVLGSARAQIFWQFMLETSLVTILAVFIAFSIAYASLPMVARWSALPVGNSALMGWQVPVFMLMLVTAVVLLAGSYPGLVLAGFTPARALKGALNTLQTGGLGLRRSLIVAQFCISQVLLIGLIVILWQMRYARESDLGFNKNAVLMIPVGSYDEKAVTLRNQLGQVPGVESIARCSQPPASRNSWSTSLYFEGRTDVEDFNVTGRIADTDYLDVFEMNLVAGRNLAPSDTAREFLINETLMHKLGVATAADILGRRIQVHGGAWSGPVVGVVKDFHDASFRASITPIFITTSRESYHTYAVRIQANNMKETLAALEHTWSTMYPDQIYSFGFLDDEIRSFYESEETILRMVQVFAAIALFIGCMGLYGLVSFMAAQKTKEIGIRKVLGGRVADILWIFGKEFSRLIAIAFLLAAPTGWWLMKGWLQGFAYQISLSVWIFIIAAAVTTFVALATVVYHAVRAARMNPVNALRSE